MVLLEVTVLQTPPMFVLLRLLSLGCKSQKPPVSTPEEAQPALPAEPAPAEAPEASAWVEEAVEAALEWEIMPGTSGEPAPVRAGELRAFFTSHPEYADPERRGQLADPACGLGSTEAAHERLQSPPEATPLVVEVTRKDWAVVVAYADVMCTSDDWTYYSHDALEAGEQAGALTAYANADEPVVIVRSGEEELARVPLEGQGFKVLRAGEDPREIGYDPSAPEEIRRTLSGDP